MPNRKRSPPATRRRALELLAGSRDGVPEALMLAHGFSVELLVELVHAGLATAKRWTHGRRPTPGRGYPRADHGRRSARARGTLPRQDHADPQVRVGPVAPPKCLSATCKRFLVNLSLNPAKNPSTTKSQVLRSGLPPTLMLIILAEMSAPRTNPKIPPIRGCVPPRTLRNKRDLPFRTSKSGNRRSKLTTLPQQPKKVPIKTFATSDVN